MLVREYLAGRGEWPGDTPEEQAVRPQDGDYVARIHQRVKGLLRQENPLKILAVFERKGIPVSLWPQYQYPRRHSFQTLINDLMTLGLLEKTGMVDEPEERGAGAIGSAEHDGLQGFSLRTWVRLAPGAEGRVEWADPKGYVRPTGRELATEVVPVAPPKPAARRQRRPASEREPAAALEEAPLVAVVRQLESRRATLQERLVAVSRQATQQSTFEAYNEHVADFLSDVRAVYPTEQFPEAQDGLNLMRNCVTLLAAEELPARRLGALENCRSSARVMSEALARPLEMPPAPAPTPAAAPTRRRRERPSPQTTPTPITTAPTLQLPETWSNRSAPRLIRHLEALSRLTPGLMMPEVQRIKEAAEGWRVMAEDAQAEEEGKDYPNEDRIDRLTAQQALLEQLRDALAVEEVEPGEQLDLEDAIDVLREVEGPAEPPATPPPPERVTRPRQRGRASGVPTQPTVPSLALPQQFSARAAERLLTHLAALALFEKRDTVSGEIAYPQVVLDELARLQQGVAEWRNVERLEERIAVLDELEQALADHDLDTAIGGLANL